jgi:hypothetical protein
MPWRRGSIGVDNQVWNEPDFLIAITALVTDDASLSEQIAEDVEARQECSSFSLS